LVGSGLAGASPAPIRYSQAHGSRCLADRVVIHNRCAKGNTPPLQCPHPKNCGVIDVAHGRCPDGVGIQAAEGGVRDSIFNDRFAQMKTMQT
jgi:hypothetical protein